MKNSPKQWANLQGYMAILFWSFAAFFVGLTSQLPPFLLTSLETFVGFIFFVVIWLRTPARLIQLRRQPWRVWLLFALPTIGYAGFYYCGLKLAPIAEANLLNYLWPLLIVVLPTILERHKLSKMVLIGSLFCFTGVICIGLNSKQGSFSFQPGHFFAIAGAFTWALYSVLTRRFPAAPVDAVGLMGLISSIFFLIAHRLFETPVDLSTMSWSGWVGVVALGLCGAPTYILWDKAMTKGDREKVAVAAYYTPLLSTLCLILFGHVTMSFLVWTAAALILGGSILARMNTETSLKNKE